MKIIGMSSNARVIARIGQQPPVTIDQYGPMVGLPTVQSIDWTVTAEPDVRGDIAVLTVNEVPAIVEEQAEAFEIQVNGEVSVLPMGADLNRAYRIRVAQSGVSEVRMRIVWRQVEDRVTSTPGEWSSPRFVSGTKDASAPAVSIEADATDIIAMEGVRLRARPSGFGVTDETRDLHFAWNYGDPGSTLLRTHPAFQDVFGTDANTSFDKIGGHVYTSAGTYTVTCVVTDRDGNTATGTTTITVADPFTVFSGGTGEGVTCLIDAEYLANDGALSSGFADETLNGLPMYRLAESASFAFRSNRTRIRLLLKRGQTHDMTGNVFNRINLARYFIDAFGTGSDPVIDGRLNVGTPYSITHDPYSIANVRIVGPYDPTIPNARPDDGIYNAPSCPKLTVYNVEISGKDVCLSIEGPIIVQSCRLGMMEDGTLGWANFAAYLSGFANGDNMDSPPMTFIGCTMLQNPNTLRRYDKNANEDPFFADHGPFRASLPSGDIAFIKCHKFTCNDWSSVDQNAVQLINRVNAFGISGHTFQMSQCLTEGGSFYFGPSAGYDGAAAVDYKISKCVHVVACGAFYGTGFGGVVFENNVIVFGSQTIEVDPRYYFSARETNRLTAETLDDPNSFNQYFRNRPNKGLAYEQPIVDRNNTIIDLRAGAPGNWEGESRINDFNDVRRANNIIHAPNISGQSATPDLDLTPKFVPLYQGRRVFDENNNVIQPEYSNVENGFLPVPLSGCTAIGAATGDEVALDDLTGTLRRDVVAGLARSTFSTGAFEPPLEE